MVSFTHKGNFSKTFDFLKKNRKINLGDLQHFGEEGVAALMAATPVDSGRTADSWDYEIYQGNGSVKIQWINRNVVDGVPIAIILQYGHGTGTGGYVEGRDYINPAMRPVFDNIVENAMRAVISL